MAPRLRCLWFLRTDTGIAWHGLDLQFSKEEKGLFFASTTMTLVDGTTALFWEDRWIAGLAAKEIAPLLHSCVPKRRRMRTTVAQDLHANRCARDI
jgi:hypothetical protein